MTDTTSGARKAHLVVAGLSGLAVTVLEFGAVRFMAPSFGQSNYVWANVIGVILLALSLGYWMGGRLADRSTSGRPLFVAYLLAAGYAVLIAFLGGALCTWLVPAELDTARLLPLAFTGSLVATLLLFAPPVLVLGMTSPFLIRLDESPGRVGRTAGQIFAVGTIGSLIGCYLAPLWLLQAVGSRATILLCAAALASLGLAGLAFDRSSALAGKAAGVLLLVTSLGLAGWVHAADVPLREQPGQVEEIESTYQTIRVVEEDSQFSEEGEYPLYGTTLDVPARFLRHDEDQFTYQSVVLEPPEIAADHLVGGRYYDHLALGALFARSPQRAALRVLVIGYAGGSVHRALKHAKAPGVRLEVLGIEIDPAVVDAGRRHLALGELETDDLTIITGEDGRTVVNALGPDQAFDLILLDAYAKTSYVPFQLASREFFAKAAEHLAPDGWIGVNLHASAGLDGRLVLALGDTIKSAEGIGGVWLVPNPFYPGSIVLWASRGKRPPRIDSTLEMLPALRTPAYALEWWGVAHVRDPQDEHIFTDDRSDVDQLADAEPQTR